MVTVRVRVQTLLLGVMMILGAGHASPPSVLPVLDRVTVLPTPKSMADFVLTDQQGRTRSLESLRGKPTLIFFGFTHCPDACPAALTKLKLLHESGGGALKTARIVMISVDGERDTPAVMKRYLATLSPDFIGLTGNPRTVADIAARFSAVAFKNPPDHKGNYEYFHSSQVFVLDHAGRLRASFADASVENMANITRRLLAEAGSSDTS